MIIIVIVIVLVIAIIWHNNSKKRVIVIVIAIILIIILIIIQKNGGKVLPRGISKMGKYWPRKCSTLFWQNGSQKKWRKSFAAPAQQKGLTIKHGRFFALNRYKIKK